MLYEVITLARAEPHPARAALAARPALAVAGGRARRRGRARAPDPGRGRLGRGAAHHASLREVDGRVGNDSWRDALAEVEETSREPVVGTPEYMSPEQA